MQNLKFDMRVNVDRASALTEIDRLSKKIDTSYDFNAAAWAIQTLVAEYNKSFNSDFYKDLTESKSEK